MLSLKDIVEETKAQCKLDAERWKNQDKDVCQICGTKGSDRRTLLISCLYALNEISDVFVDLFDVSEKLQGFYGVRICKGCRAQFMTKLAEWVTQGGRKANPHLDDDGIYGYTEKEWTERNEGGV